jgi:aspartate racemase
LHRVIYEELCRGQIVESSRAALARMTRELVEKEGVEGVILGCTEITMLLDPSDFPVPAFDTTALHAAAAVDLALAQD